MAGGWFEGGRPGLRTARMGVVACWVALLSMWTTHAWAAPDSYGLGTGRDGALTALLPNQVVNAYSALAADVSRGATTIQVSPPASFSAGALIMIWQTKDGTFTSGDVKNVSLGSSGPGRYELARISAVSGQTLTLDHALVTSFRATGAQVVLVREYTTVFVGAAGSIIPAAWDGTKGGIVAFLANVSLTLSGNIVVDGAGFRGGATSNNQCSGNCSCATPPDARFDAPCSQGLGRRGEGIDSSSAGVGTCGTGNKANAAGGGGLINAGGAGGGNGGFGGAGGNAWCSGARAGGYAGTRLVGTLLNSLTLGGAGGGGQQDSNTGAPGGNGGGVIWIRAAGISGTGSMRANGANGSTVGTDGGSGGGAGGSILVRVNGVADCNALRAQGGNGSGGSSSVGGGGGGGGGRIWLDSPGGGSCTVTNTAGTAAAGYSFPANWSGNGTSGVNEACDSDLDTCSDCGGVSPANDGTDTDKDGICNQGDDDDDNDGTPDQLDSSLADACVPSTTPPACTTGDADSDGILNGIECPNPLNCTNTDGTDKPDYLDTDSDNDTVLDSIECTQSPCQDTDHDGLPDYRDPDSDNDGDGDGTDCARLLPAIHHGATEIIGDGIDENCDGKELCYYDRDNDGYLDGSGATIVSNDLSCTGPYEGMPGDPTTDCNDNNAAIHPGATELVGDEIDENCDGKEMCFNDRDSDGYLDTSGATIVSSNVTCRDPYEARAGTPTTDCNDFNAAVHPGATEIIGDGIDENCDGQELCYDDRDGDGYLDTSGAILLSTDLSCRGPHQGTNTAPFTDCDDNDPTRHPGATEACDLIDSNCNGSLVDGFLDTDGDGIPDCVDPDDDNDGDPDTTDCAPLDPTISHNASDANCDHIDNNCNGKIDEDGDPQDAACTDKDADGDGIKNGVECLDVKACRDTEHDGTPDYKDTDSDSDQALDADECTNKTACEDADADGLPDYLEHKKRDTDADGVPDQKDSDSDDDGAFDGDECTKSDCPDTDGDTIPDALDADDQGPGPGDCDGDGLTDHVECSAFVCEDTDGDEVPDYTDTDSDGDGVLDPFDPAPRDPCLPNHKAARCLAESDGGVVGDAGAGDGGTAAPDAGADAGVAFDAGLGDAGAFDAGMEQDAGGVSPCLGRGCHDGGGMLADAGALPVVFRPTGTISGGGCSVEPGAERSRGLWLGSLAFALLLTRRRRRLR